MLCLLHEAEVLERGNHVVNNVSGPCRQELSDSRRDVIEPYRIAPMREVTSSRETDRQSPVEVPDLIRSPPLVLEVFRTRPRANQTIPVRIFVIVDEMEISDTPLILVVTTE